jgi:type IV pilus assembly protein PilF
MKRAVVWVVVGVVVAGCGPNISEQSHRLAENLVALAHESYGNNDLGDALRKGLQATETDPTNPDATYVVAFVYAARSEYVEAERYFKKTLELDGTYTDARNALGQIYNNQGRYTEAIAILEEAAQDLLYPTPHLLQGNLGQAYIGAEQYDKAIEWLVRSVREEPRFCVGYYRLGDAYARKGDDASAEQALSAAVAVDDPGCRGLQPAWRMLGEVRLRVGKTNEAAEAFARCVEVDRESEDGAACAAALGRILPEAPPSPSPVPDAAAP